SADLSFTRQLLDSIHVRDLVGAPDKRYGLRAQSLNFEKLQHGGMVFLQQLDVSSKATLLEEFLQVVEHTFANTGNLKNLLRIRDQVGDALRQVFDRLRGVAIGANAERILPIDSEQVGSFVQQVGDGLVIHAGDQHQIK